MSDFVNKYPYTDFHQLNLDFILDRITRLEENIEKLKVDAVVEATEAARVYVDSKLDIFTENVAELRLVVNSLSNEINTLVEEVTIKLDEFEAEIAIIKQSVIDTANAVNERTDKAIEYNNEYIFRTIEDDLSNNVRIINFFTGEKMTIQDMFNYLASLHANEGLTISEFVNADKTVNDIVAINASVSNWIINGRNLIA